MEDRSTSRGRQFWRSAGTDMRKIPIPRLCTCFLFLIFFFFACADDGTLYEDVARCVAHCMNYNADATSVRGTYTCNASCHECSAPCGDLPQSLSVCKANCPAGSTVCMESCEYIETMGNASTDNSLLPARPGKPKIVGGRLMWEKMDYQFYSRDMNTHRGVVFLLLGSRALLHPDGSIDAQQLSWTIIQHSPEMSVNIPDIGKKIWLICGQSYVFKVAAFNEFGTRGYRTISALTTGELLNKSCVSWHPVGAHPPVYCLPNPSLNRTLLNLLSSNQQDDSLYQWTDGCSDVQATRVVVWNRPHDIAATVEFCYEVYVTTTGSDCDIGDRVYYVRGNETEVILEKLQPSCSLLVAVYAGTLDKSEVSSADQGLKLPLTIPQASPDCSKDYEFISFAMNTPIFNETSELYHITFTWKNPPLPVDYFRLHTQLTQNMFLIDEVRIEAVNSPNHMYVQRLDVLPGHCFRRIWVQPVYQNAGYQSSQLPNVCIPSLSPSPPVNVTIEATSDSVTIHWQKPIIVHSHYPIVGYLLMWAPVTDDLDQIDTNDPSTDSHIVPPSLDEYKVTGLLPNHQYLFQVSALSEAGNSSFTELKRQRTAGVSSSSDGIPIVLIAGPVAGLVALIVIIVIIAVIAIRREKHKLKDYIEQLELDSFRPPMLPPANFNPEEEPDEWEIEPWNLFLLDVLGEGFFGVVIKGELRHDGAPVTANNVRPLGTLWNGSGRGKFGHLKMEKTVVACKMLKEMGTLEDQADLMEEISLMKKIAQHKHIVSILGCITRTHPVCLIVEYCEYGDLLRYLRDSRPPLLLTTGKRKSRQIDNPYSSVPGALRDTEGYVPMAAVGPSTPEKKGTETEEMDEKLLSPTLSSLDLLSFARQIGLGMEYLSEKGLVHRDLACRNVLVAEDNLLKISDFGLTRAVYKDATYTQKTRGRMPLKWMALESITDRVFTTESDIWSFGIVLWEICTLGGFPYPTISNHELLKRLLEHYRMERPENCSEELYSIMLQCWHPDPDSRPPFSSLVMVIEDMMDTQEAALYVALNFEADNPYWISASELSDSDSDAEPEYPFQDTYLQQISFSEGGVHGSLSRMAKQARHLSGLDEGEIAIDPFLNHVSIKDCHSDTGYARLENGHLTMVNGAGKGAVNGRTAMNGGVTVHVAGHSGNSVTPL